MAISDNNILEPEDTERREDHFGFVHKSESTRYGRSEYNMTRKNDDE